MRPNSSTFLSWARRGIVCVSTGVVLAQGATDRPLYAPMFEASYHGMPGHGLVVLDTSIAMPALQGRDEPLLQSADLPLALRRAAGRVRPAGPKPIDPGSLPAGIRLVPERAARAATAGGTTSAWRTFKRGYDADGWIAFSEGVVTPEGLDALVYYEAACGGLCGEEGYAWLHRDSTEAVWVLEKKIVKRLS